MAISADEMLIDEVMAEFDATIAEHVVVDAPPGVVYQAARDMDFLGVRSPVVDTAMFLRSLPDKIARRMRREPPPPAADAMRLSDMFDGEPGGLEGWLAVGEVPGRELVFGAVGKVWQPDIDWKTVTAEEFTNFDEPDHARIAVAFSVRPYGSDRTVLSYEARTVATDDEARRKFLRYWWLVRRVVKYVMRAALLTVKDLAETQKVPASV